MGIRKKKIGFILPKHSKVHVVREHALRSPVFVQTRILAFCFFLTLVTGCVAGTMAYMSYTGNQTPNRGSVGDLDIVIGEAINGPADGTTATFDFSGEDQTSVASGFDNKRVKIKVSKNTNMVNSRIQVSFVLLLASNKFTENTKDWPTDSTEDELGYTVFNQKWGEIKSVYEDGYLKNYIETDVAKIYLDEDYASAWEYDDNGVFTTKRTYGKGETTPELLSGLDLTDNTTSKEYKDFKVQVIAQAINEDEEE